MIIVSLDEARSALRLGQTIESPPGAAGAQGIGWWRAMLTILRAEFGAFESVLDCGNAPGLALAALRDGIPCVRVDAPPEVMDKLRAIADAGGSRVVQ